jgi:hypothetical protein
MKKDRPSIRRTVAAPEFWAAVIAETLAAPLVWFLVSIAAAAAYYICLSE